MRSAGAQATDIDTKGYESLQQLVNNTTHDSFELYYGLFMYNQVYTRAMIARLSICGLGAREGEGGGRQRRRLHSSCRSPFLPRLALLDDV